MEEWKAIKGYEGIYEASIYGKIKSLSRTVNYPNGNSRRVKERILKFMDSDKCSSLLLHKNGKTHMHKVHHLIWETFSNTSRDGLVIHHIDNDVWNNHLTNLQLVTTRVNTSKGWQEKGKQLPTGVTLIRLTGKFKARIYIDGKPKDLGNFDSSVLASTIYQKALKEETV